MRHLLTIILLAVALSGCSSLRSNRGGGVKAPPHIQPHIENLMNATIAGMQQTQGVTLRWDRSWDLRIVEVPIIRYQGGVPVIKFPDNTEGVGAYYDPARKTIFVPNRDLRRDTLVHEFGHFLLHHNGHGLTDHHERFPRFFNRYRYGGGRVL